MSYRVDAERYSASKLTRVLFSRHDVRHSVHAAVVNDSLMMNAQTDLNSACHSYIAHIVVRSTNASLEHVVSFFCFLGHIIAFSALTPLVGWQEEMLVWCVVWG